MAAARARMRLTVEILPLEAENSHGPYQAAALAAFKGRKFALPVQLEDNFEQVWTQIEERYKRNYLTPPQAASFTIKKLQDAYDCDLDLSDTVSSIYEGENDQAKHTIKVVPSFINRDFSVPFTSNLRPATAQKRQRGSYEDPAHKRRRLEQQNVQSMENVSRDRPLPSTESGHSGDDGAGLVDTDTAQTIAHLSRSKSGSSVIITHNVQTGLGEYAPGVKEESPELGDPVVRLIEAPHRRQPDRPRQETPQQAIHESLEQNGFVEFEDQDMEHTMKDMSINDKSSLQSLNPAKSLESSNDPTSEHSEPIRNGAAIPPRKSIYETSGSPEFVGGSAKRLKTYGRFPRTPKLVQKQAHALQGSRSQSKSQETRNRFSRSYNAVSGKARALQKSKPDKIESTPQAARASSMVSDANSNSTRAPGGRSSPKVVIAEVASKLLNASRIPPPAKESPLSASSSSPQGSEGSLIASQIKPTPGKRLPRGKSCETCYKGKRKCRHGENSQHDELIPSIPDHEVAIHSTSNVAATKKLRARTEIPLLDNVKHLARPQMALSSPLRRSMTKSEVPLPDNVQLLNKPINAGSIQPDTPSNPHSVRKVFQPSSPPTMPSLRSTTKEPLEISSGASSFSDDPEEEVEVEEVVVVVEAPEEQKIEGTQETEDGEEEKEDEKNEESPVKSRSVKETPPVQPELEEAILEEANAATSGDAKSQPDANKPQTLSDDEQASPEIGVDPDTADSSEPPRSPIEVSSAADNKGNSSPRPIPWNAGSWENGATHQMMAVVAAPQKPDVKMSDMSKSQSRSRSGSAVTTESRSKSVAQTKSRSTSGVDSTRSSPAVARRPARFLSQSPTPNNSSSENESAAAGPALGKTIPWKLANGKVDEVDSDSSSSDSDNSNLNADVANGADAEDSDVEMVDANLSTKAGAVSSSTSPSPRKSRGQVPPALQPLPRKSEVSFPSTQSKVEVPSTLPSTAPVPKPKVSLSQPNSQTPATGLRRPTHQKFPSIKQQLSAAKSTPAINRNTGALDARTLKLSKLIKAKQQGKKGVVLNESSSSDESSSDNSDSEDERVGKKAGCSVA